MDRRQIVLVLVALSLPVFSCEKAPPPPRCPDCCDSFEDCASQACDSYERSSRGTLGRCVPEDEMVYINNLGGTCSGAHTGSRTDPLCTLDQGLALLAGRRTALRVAPSSRAYGPLRIAGGSIRIYGPYNPSTSTGGAAAIIGDDLATDALLVAPGASAVLDGLVLTRGKSGARCQGPGSRLSLRRSRVSESLDVGLDARGCALLLDRVSIAFNRDGALSVSAGGTYDITNSFFVGNSSPFNPALRFSDDSTGRLRFSTVAGNGSIVPAAVSCGTVPRDIEDSIIAANTIPAGRDSQLSGACRLRTVVVGAGDVFPGGVRLDPEFVKPAAPDRDFRLVATSAANDACCIDRATGADLLVDHFGTARPQRRAHDIGASEVR